MDGKLFFSSHRLFHPHDPPDPVYYDCVLPLGARARLQLQGLTAAAAAAKSQKCTNIQNIPLFLPFLFTSQAKTVLPFHVVARKAKKR